MKPAQPIGPSRVVSPGNEAAIQKLVEGAALLLGYAAAAFVITYPLFKDPTRTVLEPFYVYSHAGALFAPDIFFSMWVMAWGWRALTTAPWSLFDANIFAPAPRTLAGSEHMLGHLPIFGPFFALSGNPVLAHQANLFLSFVLCGCAMYALLRHWGTSRLAAFLGGFIYAFAPVRLHGMGHSHLLATYYLPLAVIFLDRTLWHGRVRSALAFAVLLLLQMLCSYYTAYGTALALTGYAAGVVWAARVRLSWRNVALVCGATLAAAVPFVAVSIPYVHLKASGIIPQYEDSWMLPMSAAGLWRNYLYPPGLIRQGWKLPHGAPNYVGILPLLTALTLVVRSFPRPFRYPWPVAGSLGSALACYVMALGPSISVAGVSIPLPYALALQFVPGFDSIRVVSRFGLVFMFGFAALVGLGADGLFRKLRSAIERPWSQPAAAAIFLAVVVIEYDFPWRRYRTAPVPTAQGLPEVYQVLKRLPPAPVLEVPAGRSGVLGDLRRESEYAFLSIFHWRPLLNGYSGYRPPSYAVTTALAQTLPDGRALELLQRTTGLRYVIVHLDWLPPAKRALWNNPAGMRVLYRTGNKLLLVPLQELPTDLLPALLDFKSREKTILGTPIQTLAADQQQADLALVGSPPASVITGLPVDLEIVVTNRSTTTWPALASVGEPLVRLAYRFIGPGGRVIHESLNAARLPDDPRPGVPVRATITLLAPRTPGNYRLVIGLSQGGAWFPATIQVPVSVKPWPK